MEHPFRIEIGNLADAYQIDREWAEWLFDKAAKNVGPTKARNYMRARLLHAGGARADLADLHMATFPGGDYFGIPDRWRWAAMEREHNRWLRQQDKETKDTREAVRERARRRRARERSRHHDDD